MGVVLGAKLPLEQQENSHHRHDDQHQIIEVTLRHDHVELDSGPGADESAYAAAHRAGEMDLTPLEEAVGGQQGTPHVAALIGGRGGMGGQAGQQIGGQGDQSAAAGHRIHQSAQKDQGADDQQGMQSTLGGTSRLKICPRRKATVPAGGKL